jgi:alpha 1,6-mannosyltransferase
MASTPNHPILLSTVLRILHATNKAVSWSHSRASRVEQMRARGQDEEAAKLDGASVLDTKQMGGPVGVMDWTGPGVWTDAVLR